MNRVILVCLILGCFQTTFGQEACTRPRPLPPAPYAAAQAPARPDGRLHHLLLAAEHLEAAGLQGKATEIRRLAVEEKDALRERLGALEAEVERLRQLLAEPQVLVHVKVLEISRSKLRKLGIDFAKAEPGGTGLFQDGPAGGRAFEFNVVDDGDALLGVLDALQQDRLARVLAEPTLVTMSGRPASCHVGGEVPAPVPQEDGTVAVEFREFGNRVDLLPIVLDKGRIRLEVRARVGRIDPSRSVQIQGQTCPGLQVSEVDTGVEMAVGQTLIVGGVVQKRAAEPMEQTAQAGEVDGAEEEVELLFLVTPELVGRSGQRVSARCLGRPSPYRTVPLPAPVPAPPAEARATR